MSNLKKDYRPFLESLDTLGFCTFRLFEDETITQLKDLYQVHFGDKEINGLYASHNSNAAEKALAISHGIEAIVASRMAEVLADYNFFLGHYVVKGANEQKTFALHQDWNIVDESADKSYQVWIPLQLTYPGNGGIFVVPGSHKFLNNYRSGSYGIPVIAQSEAVKRISTNLIVPAGNVIIYQNGLFHASHPNNTDQIRAAVIVNYVEKKARTFFFQKNEEKKCTELYAVTGDSLIAHLPDLEKGITGSDLTLHSETPLNRVVNEKITERDLIRYYDLIFPGVEAPQVKQLHVAKDPRLEQLLDMQGYAVVDFLNEEEVLLFKEKYQSTFGHISREAGRFTTLQHTDAQTKRSTHDFIVANTLRPLDKLFKDYIVPVSQYYTKKAHTSGDIDLHADSTLLINHQLEPHYAIWVPLVDVDETNGCLTVIPQSHKNQQAVYGGSFRGRQETHREWLRQYELAIPLRAGQAVIFDNNTLHNSTPNVTGEDRICFTFRMTHMASDYYSFISQAEDKKDLDVYLESHNYYMDEMWDGGGAHISGKPAGTMQDGLFEFEKTDILAEAGK
jgi:ectoine hydroxylase-related dioxygenase (phytanoyl-CoA dioxygenase family)